MSRVLTDQQVRWALSIASKEQNVRWEWGDWAIQVAGLPGAQGQSDGSRTKLQRALTELAAERENSLFPSLETLVQYREAAAAVRPDQRDKVKSIDAARTLGQQVKDEGERVRVVDELASQSPKGRVTADAVRERFNFAPKRPATPKVDPELAARVKQSRKDARDGVAHPVNAYLWKMIGELNGFTGRLNGMELEVLEELSDPEWAEVVEAIRNLQQALERWVTARTAGSNGDVIESRARRIAPRALTA